MTSLSTNVSAGDMMESPLHHHADHTNATAGGIVMAEDKFRGHLNLRGNPETTHLLLRSSLFWALHCP